MGTRRPPLRGRRRDSIALPGGRRDSDPGSTGMRVAEAMADGARINVAQEHEVRYWSKKFGVSANELRSAVAEVGPMVKNVRDHLHRRS